jgi:hypothetical protein
MHHDEADRPSIDISRRRRVSKLDNASHHHPQCLYPHTSVFSKHATRRSSQGNFPRTRALSRPRLSEPVNHQGVYIFPEWTFGVLNVSRANCTNEWREPTYGTAFSNERKRRNEALGFPVFISVYHSRISLVFSDHAQTNPFAREPEK